MKKIRILALLLAVLMIPFSLLVACKKDGEDNPCADGHQWNSKEVTIEKRTCTEPGIKERTCKVCKLTEQYDWLPEGHTISKAEWIYDEDATCVNDGHETRYCPLCTYSETRVKPDTALGHNFVIYVLGEDSYSETSVCDRCSVVTDTRLVGIDIDFEGEKNTLSYGAFTVYTAEGVTDYYKTEGEGEALNSYLQIDRTAEIGIGDHGYGAIFAPGYSRLKTNKYVAEFDIKINKDSTKDLVLLSGNKEFSSVDFLTYDADTHTISITYGPIYTLKETDYDRWMKLSVVLNDVERKYEFYIDNKLVIPDVDYQVDDYYVGMDLENFKIAMTHEVGTPSTFALDNIDVYIGISPKGYDGHSSIDADYAVYTTTYSQNKIMYKKLVDGCEHDIGETVYVEADCYTDGYSYKECSKCNGQTEYQTTGAKLNHMQNGVSTIIETGRKDSTCTEYGGIFKECSLCGYKDKEVIEMLPHEIDTEAPSYINIPASCTADGIIKGECKNCQCAVSLFNGEYKWGHNYIEADVKVVQEANCIRDGYSTVRCINPGCGTELTVNEVPAYGHTMKTVIKDDGKGGKTIENYCLRCNLDEYKTSQPLSVPGVYPTLTDMQNALSSNFYGGTDGAGFSSGNFDTGNSKMAMRFTNDGSSSTAAKMTEAGNTFLRINHTATGYLNYLETFQEANQDIVIELSLRLPATGKAVTGTMTAAQRITGHNVIFSVFKLDEAGDITFIPGNCVIGKLNSTTFSKLSFVVKPGTGMVDAYFNGELKAQNCLMKAGEMGFVPDGGVVYEYRFLFDKMTSGSAGIDVDDMYMYQASIPVYVTNPFVTDAAQRNYDVTKNATSNAGPYIQNNVSGVIGTNMLISSNKGFRAYVESGITDASGLLVSALHCIKGDTLTSISGADTSRNDSEISTSNDVLKSSYAVIYNEVKFNAGSFSEGKMNTGRIVLAQGKKQVAINLLQDFLVVEDGVLRLGDGKKLDYTIKQDEWISYNIVIDEYKGTYDIYINGNCLASGVKCSTEYVSDKYSQCGYKFMVIDSGEFDFYMANTALYVGAIAPVSDVNAGDIEKVTVKTELTKKVDAVTFYEGQSVSSYYDYVGKIVLSDDKNSLLTLSDTAKYANKDGVSIAKVDNRVVLRTKDYKTNNLKAIEFKNLMGTRLVSDTSIVYDLSNYDYLTVTFNVEATKGYNIIFKLMTENGEDGYYQMRFYVISTGWQTVMLPLKANAEHENLTYFKSYGTTTGLLNDVTSLRIEFEGDIAGNGNGKLMDGTTVSFEKICFEKETEIYEKTIGENINTGNFCKSHDFTETTEAPTCTSSGYTMRVCKKCGYISVKNIKNPTNDVKQNADHKVISAEKPCLTDSIELDRYTCACGDDYYVITKVTLAKEHDVTEGSCTGCDKELNDPVA